MNFCFFWFQHEQQELRSKVLLRFGRCAPLRQGVLVLLARCLSHFGGGLRQVLKKDVPCQPQACENIFYIFDCLEKLLLDLTPGGRTGKSNDIDIGVTPSNPSKTGGKFNSRNEPGTNFGPSKDRVKPTVTMDSKHLTAAPSGTNLPKEVLDTISIQLEDSLVLISQHFPCYAYVVWHLKGIVEQIQNKT